MRNGMWYAVLMAFLLTGCAGANVSPDAVELGVDFSWKGIKKCSRISPRIRVSNIPVGTVTLAVKLKDLDVPSWNHGGGSVAFDGDGILQPGALDDGYNGPCPPGGSHRYQFTVKAINGEGVVIGMGKSMRKFP